MENLKQFRDTRIYASKEGVVYAKTKTGKLRQLKGSIREKVNYWFHNIQFADGSFLNKYTHQIITECFLGPCPDGYEVDHINNDKHDNRLVNLQYLTRADNARKGVIYRMQKRAIS